MQPAEGAAAGAVAGAIRGTTPPLAVVAGAIKGAILKAAATLSQDAAGTRAGTSTLGTRAIAEGIKGGAAAVSCTRWAHHKGC